MCAKENTSSKVMNNNISAAQNGDEHERDFHSEGAQVGENTEKVFGKNLKS